MIKPVIKKITGALCVLAIGLGVVLSPNFVKIDYFKNKIINNGIALVSSLKIQKRNENLTPSLSKNIKSSDKKNSSISNKANKTPIKKQSSTNIQATTEPQVLRPEQIILDVPLISQLPQLPRGCEVTSLAMMLQYAGVNVDKMTLASKIKKDTTPYKVLNEKIFFGNPNVGFVGDMYSFSNPGLGVYHGPIKELAEQYLPSRIIDLTGNSFDAIFKYLDNGSPVWVINNVLFDVVPPQYWQTWYTPTGVIQVTKKEHSVLITGYDANYIYFNDPLANIKNQKAPIENFIRGWEQMGSQAITYK